MHILKEWRPHGLTPLLVPSAMCSWSHQEVDAAEDQDDPEPAHHCISQVGTNQGGQVHSSLPHLQLQGGVRGVAGGGGTQRGDQGLWVMGLQARQEVYQGHCFGLCNRGGIPGVLQ
jgi:hypothetical protein